MKTPKQRSLVESFLFDSENRFSDLPQVLQQLLGAGADHIRGYVLMSEVPLTRSLPEASRRSAHRFTPLFDSESSVSGEISGTIGRTHQVQLSGKVLAVQHPHHSLAWILLTYAGGAFENGPLKYFLRSVRPRLSNPILRSSQIEQVFDRVSSLSAVHDLRLRQVGSRTKISSEGAEKSVESDRRWTDLSAREAFEEARELGQWVTDATATYRWQRVGNAWLKITRLGHLTFRHAVEPVFTSVVDEVASMGVERYRFLKNRARSPETNFRSRPFHIDFKFPVLSGAEQVHRLRNVLQGMPAVTCTVLHGNPYFHASLVDYRDGSSYEVLVLGDSRLTIIPQGRSTVAALQRVCANVFSDFREGQLTEVGDG